MDEKPNTDLDTREIQAIYCNHASVSLSFNDLRIFLSEIIPQTVSVGPQQGDFPFTIRQPYVRPHISVVITPEFARTLSNALNEGVSKYEKAFGPLRAEPSQEHVLRSFSPPEEKK